MTDTQHGLLRLVRDLQAKETLCCADGVSLEQLNRHVMTHGPLVHPVLGDLPGFFVDDGRFIPFRMAVPGRSVIRPQIITLLIQWVKWGVHGGRVSAQGKYFLDGTLLRAPDVAYTPRPDTRQATDSPEWTLGGAPFAPTFVVEIDTLAGPHSGLEALDDKLRREYFPNGVQLGWLIDPANKIMYEYKRDAQGNNGLVRRVDDETWRDLDGGTVLPGFQLQAVLLDMVLSPQVSGSSSEEEEEEDLVCPYSNCRERFRTSTPIAAHIARHQHEKALAKYLAQ
ncbi:hypothetical protein PHYSODRAFT_314582 [Phytophthora sojae]|uniref:C2H2-type domain-containing protein n=1 Tax=Phytophthora sojae (strain P6497) TaxID=1094619 RepID=G4ZGK8_PHYSP|nr:hypothetical protein PHYSODRAFT_314582 [Phytophthora sojae]EGZ17090.1 hypothetical protein PHYSODRAFT_314582 [Phytophthora sojae]|eukprot:XP_009526148.1 hypothetical protein PHYSODRAFT_314582 [Phytophthora sojae]